MTHAPNPAPPARTTYKPQPRSFPMPTNHRGEPIEILLVEDSPDDADLTIDTSALSPEEAVTQVFDHLVMGGWVRLG